MSGLSGTGLQSCRYRQHEGFVRGSARTGEDPFALVPDIGMKLLQKIRVALDVKMCETS